MAQRVLLALTHSLKLALMKFYYFVNNSVQRLKEGLGDERRVEKRVIFLAISIISKGCSYILNGVRKHHLLGAISQVFMIVLFDA